MFGAIVRGHSTAPRLFPSRLPTTNGNPLGSRDAHMPCEVILLACPIPLA